MTTTTEFLATVKLTYECDICGQHVEIVKANEVENVVTIKPCENCTIKKANELFDEAKETIKEKFELMKEEVDKL